MPSSSKQGKAWTTEWIKNNKENIKTVLDLGCGEGTYSNLFRKKNDYLANCFWVGVEVWEPYIEQFSLKEKYDQLLNQDIRYLEMSKLGQFDLCFLGDVLEHVTKEESIKIVETMLNYCKTIIISIPIVHMPQGPWEGNPYEIHVKDDWSDEEVKSTFPNIVSSTTERKIGVYVLKGNI